jgi:hypothetical protein
LESLEPVVGPVVGACLFRFAYTAAARVRRTAINVVDVCDVTTCQNMVDVSDVTACQNKHARVFCVCDVTEGQKPLVGTFWSWQVLNIKLR